MTKHHSYFKAGAGLLATGNYIYNLFKKSGKTPNFNQHGSKSLSRIPDKYLTSASQMAKKSYSYSPSKRLFKRKIRFLRKAQKKKKYKFKKFSKYLNKVSATTSPYMVLNSEDYQSVVSQNASTSGNSTIYGFDIGMCRYGLLAPLVGNFNSTTDDIAFAINQATQGVVGNQTDALQYSQDIHIDKMSAIVTLRNNSNIGVSVEPYWIKPRKSQSVDTQVSTSVFIRDRLIDAMNKSYNPPILTADTGMGYSESLFDYPIVCSRFKLKKLKKFILYPAQTKMFNMASPVQGKTHNISNLSSRTSDPRYHRSLIFVFKGLPVHDSSTPDFTAGPVAYGPYKVDCIVSRKIKVRYVQERTNDSNHTITNSRIPTIVPASAEIQPAVNPANALVTS